MPKETISSPEVHKFGSLTADIFELTSSAIDLSLLERATPHPAGRKENVWEHSLSLSFVAGGIAEKHYPELDVNLVARYGIVHDLVEKYAGETPTYDISDEELEAKYAREAEALGRITEDYAERFPVMVELIENYEHQVDKEARYVRCLDKCLPAILNLKSGLDGLQTAYGSITIDEFRQKHEIRMVRFRQWSAEFPELIQVKEELFQMIVEAYFSKVSGG